METTEPNEIRGRRATIASLPSLLAMVAVFFLPTLPSCDRMESPLSYGLTGVGSAAITWTVFAAAVALLVGSVVAFAVGGPSRRLRLTVAPFVAAVGVSSACVDVLLVTDDGMAVGQKFQFVVLVVPWLLLGVAAARFAVRFSGWRGWIALIAAWFGFGAVSFPGVMIASGVVDAPETAGPGAWLWMGALAALPTAIAVAAAAPPPRGPPAAGTPPAPA